MSDEEDGIERDGLEEDRIERDGLEEDRIERDRKRRNLRCIT